MTEKPVRTLPMSAPFHEAIAMLAKFGGSIAIVDALNTVRGHFSAVDCKGLFIEKAPRFHQTIERFLRSRSRSSLEPITVCMTDTLETMECKFIKYGTHQMWLVDRFSKPQASISLTDYLAICARSSTVQ